MTKSKDALKVQVVSGRCKFKGLTLVLSFAFLGSTRTQENQFFQELVLRQMFFLAGSLKVSA